MKVWICAIAKMEELYIREWIEWHKKIGIDHIILGDNNDSDYDKPLYPIIQDYINEGYVELINKNDVLGAQQNFYNEIYQTRKNEFDWIGFIDIDEFIELPAYDNNIHKFLYNEIFINTDGIILCWKIFNDNNQIYYNDRPVKERFTSYITQTDIGIKYFIRGHIDNIKHLHSIHNPLNTKYNINNYSIRCCDVLGNINFERMRKGEITKSNKFASIICNQQYYNVAYISHYITKSTEEYIKFRMLRGRCDRKVNKHVIRYTKDFYFSINNISKEKLELFDKYENDIIASQNIEIKKYNTN